MPQQTDAPERPVVRTREIIEDIHTATGYERGQIGTILTALYDAIAVRLNGGADIDLRDFMTFAVKTYGEREFFVPKRGEFIERGPSSRVRVNLATKFKKRVKAEQAG